MALDSTSDSQELSARSNQPLATPLHTLILFFVVAAWAVWGLVMSNHQRAIPHPHRVSGYLLTMVWEWGVFAFVYFGVRRRGVTMRQLIGGRWSTPVEFLKDLGVSAIFWFVALAVLALTARALHLQSPGQNVRFLLPQTRLELFLWILLSTTAGICEETIFRGYLQKQLFAWLKSAPLAVVISALAFGAGHIYQGAKSATVIVVYGLLFGILAEWRKSLRPGMMTHAWHDAITGVAVSLMRK
jgi:CAAX protease family protein